MCWPEANVRREGRAGNGRIPVVEWTPCTRRTAAKKFSRLQQHNWMVWCFRVGPEVYQKCALLDSTQSCNGRIILGHDQLKKKTVLNYQQMQHRLNVQKAFPEKKKKWTREAPGASAHNVPHMSKIFTCCFIVLMRWKSSTSYSMTGKGFPGTQQKYKHIISHYLVVHSPVVAEVHLKATAWYMQRLDQIEHGTPDTSSLRSRHRALSIAISSGQHSSQDAKHFLQLLD